MATPSAPSDPFPSSWPRVWRGESSGEMFEDFDLRRTNAGCGFFFAQEKEHAQWYAATGTHPRAFVLDPGNCLDLRDPLSEYLGNPVAKEVIDALRDEFDEWVDRTSGDSRGPLEWLEEAALYSYEGTGSGQRWNTLFRLAWAHGFDSVVALDVTDANRGEVATTWVVKDARQIHFLPTLDESALIEKRRRREVEIEIEPSASPPVQWVLRR